MHRPTIALGLTLFSLCACSSGADDGVGASIDSGSLADTGSSSDAPATDESSPRDGAAEDVPSETAPSPCSSPSLSENEKKLIAMPADSWMSAPGSSFLAAKVCADAGGVEGCGAVIDDWSGGAYDAIHTKMLMWGGGHDGYWGNEVYAFSPVTFKWEMLTKSSKVTGDNQSKDPLDDGMPVSRHTYDQIAYIDHADRMWSRGGAIARSGGGSGVTWTLDVGARSWKNMSPTGSPGYSSFGPYAGSSAYDRSSKKVFLKTVENFFSYDYDTNAYAAIFDFGYPPYWPRYMIYGPKRATVDTKRHMFWSLGSGDYFVYDIAASKAVTNDWITTGGGDFDNTPTVGTRADQQIKTGGGDIISAGAPGFDYDEKADQMVAWKGGAPYVLDLATKIWTMRSAIGAPPTQVSNGTYGRFRYIAKYNVFILINQPNDEVVFYKNKAGCGG